MLLAAFAVLLIFWILCGFRFPRLVWPCALSVVLVAGALTASSHARPPDPELDADAGETLLLSGCIESPVAADGLQSRFVLELEPGARARVTLTTRPEERLPTLQYGDRIEVQAKVESPELRQSLAHLTMSATSGVIRCSGSHRPAGPAIFTNSPERAARARAAPHSESGI